MPTPEEIKAQEEKEAQEKKDLEEKALAEAKKTEEHMIPQSRLNEVLGKLKDANDRADALDKAQKKADRKRLEEQESYKELYENSLKEIEGLKPDAEEFDTANKALANSLAAQIEAIPEDRRTLVPTALSDAAQLDWIAQNRALLSKSTPIKTGAGEKGGSEETSVDLTADQKQIASDFGMSEKEYAAHIQKDDND